MAARVALDGTSEDTLTVCHAGQTLASAAAATVSGALVTYLLEAGSMPAGSLLAGSQSLVQLGAQTTAAAVVAYVMAFVEFGDPLGEGLPPELQQRGRRVSSQRQAALSRLVGALVGAALVRLLFPSGLDFSLLASAILIAACSVGAGILLEPDESLTAGDGDSQKPCLGMFLLRSLFGGTPSYEAVPDAASQSAQAVELSAPAAAPGMDAPIGKAQQICADA
eukprot:TRINITY_DN25632_c0_g1_i1.p1 TRINITY_DN25632_c0_g1~~TRINITY_DN25632_c0_g1_i1.p1  ORF type:complete len:238 (-),score=43.03 TRINITY_DN25632_c0_g1_i1:23-691(-)